ncbi:MAG: hypothetical protein PHP30_05905 [Bacteroidales bacterium]|nr:hypothetical protein [Bacteroidales bacterium]MDD3989612.1 hypothetical protein [Bacteroidales bacterium]
MKHRSIYVENFCMPQPLFLSSSAKERITAMLWQNIGAILRDGAMLRD